MQSTSESIVERIILKAPPSYSRNSEDTEVIDAMLKIYVEMEQLFEKGEPIYLEWLTGPRCGSISRLVSHKSYKQTFANARLSTRMFPIYGSAKWDDKSHKPDCTVYFRGDFAWLKGYDGPTVWKKIDLTDEYKELKDNPNQRDIHGNTIAVGDKVYFCNMAYGQGSTLMVGKIADFHVVKGTTSCRVVTEIDFVIDGVYRSMKTENPHRIVAKIQS